MSWNPTPVKLTIASITLFNMRCYRFSFNSLFFFFSIFLVDGVPVKLGLSGISFYCIVIIELKALTRGLERTFSNICLGQVRRTREEDWRTISTSTSATQVWLPACRLVMLVGPSVHPASPSRNCSQDWSQDWSQVVRGLRTWSISSSKWEMSPNLPNLTLVLVFLSLQHGSIPPSSSSYSSRLLATRSCLMSWRRSYSRRPTPWCPARPWWAITLYSACQGIQNHIQFSGAGGTLTAADIMKALKDNLEEDEIPPQYQFGESSLICLPSFSSII